MIQALAHPSGTFNLSKDIRKNGLNSNVLAVRSNLLESCWNFSVSGTKDKVQSLPDKSAYSIP